MELLEKLKAKMADAGYRVDSLRADGSYHRFKVGKRKGTPGYYKILDTKSGMIALYGDFVSGQSFTWTSSDKGNGELSQEAAARLKKVLAKEQQKARRNHDKGAMAASFFWNTGDDVTTHQYLKAKAVKSYGLKLCTLGKYKNWLMVPGLNADGEIRTINYIHGDGAKRFEKGAEKKECFYELPGNDDRIILCEGYSTAATIRQAAGDTVVVCFDVGNLLPVAKVIREKYPETEIIIAADNDQFKPELGNIGLDTAIRAAIEIDAKIAVPEFKDTSTKPTDFNDLATLEGHQVVSDQIKAARPIDKAEALKREVTSLVDLDLIEREIWRNRLVEKYKVRKSVIDDYLRQLLKLPEESKSVVSDTEPAADPVDGAGLLDKILADMVRRVILPEGAAEAITAWLLLTYCHTAFNVLPLLGITSPTKRCGKTTLIEILQGLAEKGLAASSLTPAAVFRTIEKYTPTLLIDEADTFLRENDELRGIINSGHTRASAFVIRVEGDNHEPVKFSTWGPKAIGMIGSLPDTIEDRAVVIKLRRKMSNESVVKTSINFVDQCAGIRSRLKRWADDNFDKICNVCISVPASGNDRADDNWYPLFAIAEVVGGGWPEKIKKARTKLTPDNPAEEAIGIKLLIDVRDIFRSHNADRIFSKDLVEALTGLTESPWADWRKGKGLNPNGMARMLKPFGIESKTMRIGDDLFKGYALKSFQDTFNRYIPGISSVTPLQSNDFSNLNENQSVTSDNDVTDENHDNQPNLFDCYDVTDEKQGNGQKEDCLGCGAWDKGGDLCYARTVFEGKSGAGVRCKDAIRTCEYNKE